MAAPSASSAPGSVDLSQYAKTSDLNAAAASNLQAMQAFVPAPASALPPPVNASGAVGSSAAFARADHTHVSSVYKTIKTTTDATGAITWTYPANFFDAVPVLQLTVETGSGQPMVALITSNTMTGGAATILRAQTLPASLTLLSALVSFNIFGGTVPTGTKVHLYAAKASA